jgi:hypothetical protein
MTTALDPVAARPLAPVNATLRAMFGTDTALPGLAPGLTVDDRAGWLTATHLFDGHMPQLLAAARRRWEAQPHAAAALAWKTYTYWLALPAVLGWASARRVPLLRSDDVLVHFEDHRPLVTLGLDRSITVAVLPTDPLAALGLPHVRVVPGDAALLDEFRASLLDGHLTPMLGALREQRVRLGARTLLGSVASGVAHAVLRSADVVPGSTVANIRTLLGALGVDDLVELVPGAGGQLTVQRKTCCLAFTLPKPKVCSGCCIRTT